MPLTPMSEMEKEPTLEAAFRQIGEGSVRFIATRSEVLSFIREQIQKAERRKVREISSSFMDVKKMLGNPTGNSYHNGYYDAINNVEKLLITFLHNSN